MSEAKPKRDPLGRPYRDDGAPPEKRKQILSDDEICTIAHEARTRPLSEVGRHVMPLIQHIVGIELRRCQGCRSWVPYDRQRDVARNGECTNPAVKDQVRELPPADDRDRTSFAVVSPFDWSCSGWEEFQQSADDAQCSPG